MRKIKIKPIISEIVKKELAQKELYRKVNMCALEVKTGKFFVDFQ